MGLERRRNEGETRVLYTRRYAATARLASCKPGSTPARPAASWMGWRACLSMLIHGRPSESSARARRTTASELTAAPRSRLLYGDARARPETAQRGVGSRSVALGNAPRTASWRTRRRAVGQERSLRRARLRAHERLCRAQHHAQIRKKHSAQRMNGEQTATRRPERPVTQCPDAEMVCPVTRTPERSAAKPVGARRDLRRRLQGPTACRGRTPPAPASHAHRVARFELHAAPSSATESAVDGLPDLATFTAPSTAEASGRDALTIF